MADTTTELEVLDEIVDVLGGQSGQHNTVVPVLEDIRDLLGGGGGGGGGYNPSLSVGRADALTGADSTAQWATRESTGSGAATVRSVQGATVVWNQLCKSINANGFVSFGSDTATVQNHKYLFIADIVKKEAANNASVDIYGKPVGGSVVILGRIIVQTSGRGSSIFTMNTDGLIGGAASVDGNYWGFISSTAQSVSNGMLFDLTQMFGSGSEPATVAEFEAMFPESYYPYSAPVLKPVQIAGIRSTDAQGNALDGVEWETQTLRAAGSVRDELTADELVTRVGVVDLGTLTWFRNEITAGSGVYAFENSQLPTSFPAATTNLKTAPYPCVGNVRTALLNNDKAMTPWNTSTTVNIGIRDDAYTTVADFKTAMSGVLLFYELATPTTTPISPALTMTYRVEQGGSESIIVPDGEVSAAPVLTIAEGESAGELVMDALACIATPDGPVATANHAVNTYLTMQGKLYKVTRAIAAGETIAAGTNVTQTTVMDELIALTA